MLENQVCDCGEIHELSADTRKNLGAMIEHLGPNITIRVEGQEISFAVPRLYIAAHGIRANEIPDLAERYGWDRVG